jgi:4-carboxymuconolactone decarboxylase
MDSELYKKGMSTRRSVLGDDHVDKAIKATTDFDRRFSGIHNHGSMGYGVGPAWSLQNVNGVS